MGRELKKQTCYITVPSEIITSLSSSSLNSLLLSPKKNSSKKVVNKSFNFVRNSKLWVFFIFLFCFMGMLYFYYSNLTLQPLTPFILSPNNPCSQSLDVDEAKQMSASLAGTHELGLNPVSIKTALVTPFTPEANDGTHDHDLSSNPVSIESDEARSFWEQPDGLGYRPSLEFSKEYRSEGEGLSKDRSKYLMVVVSGGMNQQRNQIVDAVVIARILGAALVAPVLQVNVVWGDESEFSDIFDLENFKRVLADDVRIVSSLPSTHLRTRPFEESRTPFHASPRWLRQHYLPKLRRSGFLLLRGLDSRLSEDLPSDLQKLRCKVAFHALKFAPHIQQLGNRVAERMSSKGPYVALHLRMEKDVWIRTGCSPGLSQDYDELINNERTQRPKLLTGKSNMTAHDRKLAGLCPLNAQEVARLLKALGAPKSARIFWAGGPPLGGRDALLPLIKEFPFFYNKEDLALPGELQPFANKASFMAAIDYIVCEKSDVFMASHGGNMGHALQGHRAYAGHKKYITPNKRHMLPYFLNSSLPELEFNNIVQKLHQDSLGQPELRTSKPGRDVTKYPVPECMCNSTDSSF